MCPTTPRNPHRLHKIEAIFSLLADCPPGIYDSPFPSHHAFNSARISKSLLVKNEPEKSLEELNEQPAMPLYREFLLFLRQNKKWWLIPILLVLALMGLLVALSGSAAAPFIYPLF